MSTITPLVPHLERVLEAKSIQAIWDLHLRKMAEYGFNRLIYGFTRFRTSQTQFGSADDVLMLSNHDQAYIEAFVHSGLYANGPMVRWALENEGPASWRLIYETVAQGDLTPGERKLLELNARFGVLAGYSISFRDLSVRAKGAIGLCARPGVTQEEVDAMWELYGHEITVINNLTHLKLTSMPFASSRRPLTPRQREALEWVGDGKTMQDIATIMGLTPATVEKHLRLAREALDVDTTAQAVLKASYQNQIFIVPN
jgi:DNA-binding CsgD family transcriptional regulator